MVDKNLILRKVAEIETYLGQIREFSDVTLQDYRKDWKTQRIVERTLQMMIEACVDVANHIISDKGMRSPVTYGDTFRVLAEGNVINAELLGIMEKMAKFRNVVVHQYEEVDAEIVLLILKKHLDDFNLFRDAVLNYIKGL